MQADNYYMLEFVKEFEQVAVRFSPVVLILPGVLCVVLGLFIWLGGLGLRKVLAAVLGSIVGGVCGFFVSGRNIILAGLSTAPGAIAAIVFEKLFVAIMTAGLAAAIGFAILVGPYVEDTDVQRRYFGPKMQDETERLSAGQSVGIMEAYAADFSAALKEARLQMPRHNLAIIAGAAVIFVGGVFFLRHFASALCCATLGTALIFGGMVLLLLYKGSAPISGICQRRLFYLGVFAVMVVFGMVEQLVLCRRAGRKAKSIRKRKTDKGVEEIRDMTADWRSA